MATRASSLDHSTVRGQLIGQLVVQGQAENQSIKIKSIQFLLSPIFPAKPGSMAPTTGEESLTDRPLVSIDNVLNYNSNTASRDTPTAGAGAGIFVSTKPTTKRRHPANGGLLSAHFPAMGPRKFSSTVYYYIEYFPR